ncbi:MAG: hypothetical protein WAU01_16095 [Saprospiraceae bacterium]
MRNKFLLLVMTCVLFSCAKEQALTFVTPSTYRYNSPNLESKEVYVIDSLTKNIRKVTDTLGTFNRPNSEIADSINRITSNEFVIRRLQSITFDSGSEATLQFGRLDTSTVIDSIVLSDVVKSTYTLNGNQIIMTALPSYYLNINHSAREVNLCYNYTLRNRKLSDGSNLKKYYIQPCTGASSLDVVKNILSTNPSVVYDTISVETVNYIFSKY